MGVGGRGKRVAVAVAYDGRDGLVFVNGTRNAQLHIASCILRYMQYARFACAATERVKLSTASVEK